MPRFCGVQRPKGAILTAVLEPIRLGNAKIATNLSRKMVVDFCVPWDRATFPGDCVVPPGMAGTLAKQLAVLSREMLYQITAFHTAMGSSS